MQRPGLPTVCVCVRACVCVRVKRGFIIHTSSAMIILHSNVALPTRFHYNWNWTHTHIYIYSCQFHAPLKVAGLVTHCIVMKSRLPLPPKPSRCL